MAEWENASQVGGVFRKLNASWFLLILEGQLSTQDHADSQGLRGAHIQRSEPTTTLKALLISRDQAIEINLQLTFSLC